MWRCSSSACVRCRKKNRTPAAPSPTSALRARVRVRDASGNEAVRSIPLTTVATPLLLAHAAGPRFPGELPPDVVLHAVRNNGRSWTGPSPTCRAPSVGELPLVAVSGTESRPNSGAPARARAYSRSLWMA